MGTFAGKISISVAMATYNGARFLREQLESLARQSHCQELVACDDGSTDATLDILERFAREAPFPVHIHRNDINLGYADNFLKAAQLCKGDWIAFCDQDDVWLPHKLMNAAAAIQENPSISMVLQDAYICDENLHHEGRLFPNCLKPGYHPPRSQFGFWVWPGFLKTIKADMLKYLHIRNRPLSYIPQERRQTHDKWTCLVANAVGGVVVLTTPVAFYRRHSKTVTGSYAKQGFAEKIEKSANVAAAHYKYLARVAVETAVYLRDLAAHADGAASRDFVASAHQFERISIHYETRAALYCTKWIPIRLYYFARLGLSGGYLGPRMSALGPKSAAKDGFQAVGMLSLLRKR